MNLEFIGQTLVTLLAGIPITLELAALAIAGGALLGFAIALMRLSQHPFLYVSAWLYVQIIRSTPLLVLLFLIYYGLGQFSALRSSFLWPVLKQAYWCAVIALVINGSAFAAEIFRGGLLSVGRKEVEAARACGMSGILLYRRIVFPLAIRQALPAYSNEMVAMVKATSLASLVTLMDVTGIAASIASSTYQPIPVFVAAGAIYLLINTLLTRAVRALEYRLTPHLRPAQYATASAVTEAGVTPT
ncbi:MAG: ABC transporter permease [Devosia sp. 67-54]|uniref:ABC transporter permease n=1 Tax=unclassified Devosia TaxID=196773 RepID=UPI0009695192|nr:MULTISPECIES: ABC transporter permease subunit [unclassified Devosia]MBN9306934.1 ABC transporter permease subunit [Devosia sp.]OJX16971.1 MAG: ABC transporter permease [Devosia sp. 67-54]